MKFQIVTPEKTVSSDEIEQVSLPTLDGEITVLPKHIPLVTILKPGELRYKKNGEEFILAVSGGFVEVRDDGSVIVLADTAEHAAEIDLVRAGEAKERASKTMSEARHREHVSFEALESQLEKQLARLRVGNKYRKIK
ncbi:MAG: F0F1 ATP synthase subunit epsilon [Patescibacteria group bacterium]|jgi:F-type H+-transporting ATPase subunit epsilon